MTATFNDYAALASAPMQAAMAYTTAFANALPRVFASNMEEWDRSARNLISDGAETGSEIARSTADAAAQGASDIKQGGDAVATTAASISAHLDKQRDDAVKSVLGAASNNAEARKF